MLNNKSKESLTNNYIRIYKLLIIYDDFIRQLVHKQKKKNIT